jgi:hypothetical protein
MWKLDNGKSGLYHLPLHGIQMALNYVTNLTDGIILLHNAHPHVAYRVQDKVNAQTSSI